jgi:hypothetical protein
MLDAMVVLWLGSTPQLAQHRADIAAWASPRQLSPVPPATPQSPGYDVNVVERIEALLEEARATSAPSAGPSAFEKVEALLWAHPELPQAAWLLAERYAIEAHALGTRAEASLELGRELERRARALEGERAEPLGLGALPAGGRPDAPPEVPATPPRPRSGAAPSASSSAMALAGVRAFDRVFVDGVDGAALEPGRHHVLVYRGNRRAWFAWVDAGATLELGARDPTTACSALDLADVADGTTAPRPAPGVLCLRWLAARPTALGGTELAECTASRCGRWQSARGPLPGDRAGAVRAHPGEDSAAAWPGWATWGLVGAGVVIATGVVLWQAGTFDRPAAATEFVFTGPSAAVLQF